MVLGLYFWVLFTQAGSLHANQTISAGSYRFQPPSLSCLSSIDENLKAYVFFWLLLQFLYSGMGKTARFVWDPMRESTLFLGPGDHLGHVGRQTPRCGSSQWLEEMLDRFVASLSGNHNSGLWGWRARPCSLQERNDSCHYVKLWSGQVAVLSWSPSDHTVKLLIMNWGEFTES